MDLLKVIKLVVILLAIVAAFMLAPLGIAVANGNDLCRNGFLLSMAAVFSCALGLLMFSRGRKLADISKKEGFLLVGLSWLMASAVGALPFYISGAIPCYSDAYFETASGFTTTGASILTNIQALPASMLFWRSLTHWLGGMGIIVLTVAILPLLGIGGLQLLKAEAPGPSVDKITPRIAQTAKILWLIYLGFTVVETLLLMAGGMDLFDALTHTFGTLATGGFSPKNSSVAHYGSSYIDWVITGFMVAAGVNFVLHYRLLTGRVRLLWRNTELKAYLAVLVIASAVIAGNLYGEGLYATAADCLRYAAFQAASILTTTGYATADYTTWPLFAQAVLFALMFVGGCSGSTGGSIKVIRVVTLFKQGLVEMKKLLSPRGVFVLKMNGKPLKHSIVSAISGFFFLYVAIILVVTCLVAVSGQDIITALTTSLATVGNIGPGFGRIGPADNYAFYPPAVKWLLSVAMIIGRLEIYTFLVLFTPFFWRR